MDKNPLMELKISVLLYKMDDTDWTENELFTIKEIKVQDNMPSSSPLGAIITLNNGEEYIVVLKILMATEHVNFIFTIFKILS